jgi:signal transduction histidine kinase
MRSFLSVSAGDFLRGRARGVARWLPFVIAALVGAIGAVIAFRIAADADETRVRGAMELRAEWRARDVERKLHILANPVAAMAVLLASMETVDPDLFHRFAEQSHTLADPLRRLAWAPLMVRPPPNVGVAAADSGGEFYPVEAEQSFTEARRLAGADLAGEPERRAVIGRSRDEARPLSTPPLRLLNSSVTGYAVVWPIYRNGLVPETIAERRAQLRGVVEGTFGFEAALKTAIQGTPPIVETIYFFADGQAVSAAPDATYSPGGGSVIAGGMMPAAPTSGAIRITRTFDVFGRTWTLTFDFAPAVLAPLRSSTVWAFPAGILALTAILLVYLAREQAYRRAVENRVAERTADLQTANAALAAEIDARQKASQQLVQAQKMEAIGNLTGGMAHDFNNLLGVIIGNLDLLCDIQSGDPAADEFAGEALNAALRGADLTRRLLAFARRQPLQPARTDVNELIGGIVKLLGRTLGEEIEITLDLNPDLWPVVVDRVQLEASLTNLATNARDAMPGGGQLIIVTGNRALDADYAAQSREVQPGEYAMIEVSDTGTGMPPETASRIFEPFYTTKEQGKGTGLGLSMVFGFIEQSGGHINVYSEVGIGTTFRLYLPRADADAEASPAGSPTGLVRGDGETVLAVEDNASLRRVVARQLGELGYRVVEDEDAQIALRLLGEERVDLIFTDIVMPGGTSGYEIADRVQSRWPQIKIVLTSGFPENRANGDPTARGLRLLSKPYRRDDLARIIREVLDS